LQTISESQFFQSFGEPETAPVKREDEQPLTSNLPEYLVRATSYMNDASPFIGQTKIADFGESFTQDDSPTTLHTPLQVRAPEVIFQDHLDHHVDMWSMGCLVSATTIITFLES
jgi:serine/threonine-protein kinase SRPK3